MNLTEPNPRSQAPSISLSTDPSPSSSGSPDPAALASAPTPTGQLGRPTLRSLVASVGALGLLAALAGIPGMGPSAEELLAEGRQVTEQTIALAQSLALSTGRQHGVVFDVEDSRLYIVDPKAGLATDPSTGEHAIVELVDNQVFLVDALFGQSRTLIFEPDGRTQAGGTIEYSADGERLHLTFDAQLGELRPTGD